MMASEAMARALEETGDYRILRRVKPRQRTVALYILPSGIEVVSEYPPNAKYPYWRVRVREHPYIVGKVVSGAVLMQRSRAVATAHAGRILARSEHVHHENGKEDDSPESLVITRGADHISRHKTGTRHTAIAKEKISASLRDSYEKGRRLSTLPREQRGERNPGAKLTWASVEMIRSSGKTCDQLAAEFDVSRSTISLVRCRKVWI